MRRSLILFAAPLLVLFLISSAFAPTDPIPHMINYQGMLTNDLGEPLDGTYDLTFSIYSISSGGSALWDETHNAVLIEDGLFNVILGSVESIPSSIFEGAERYLGIKVGADPELTPRTRLTSVGFAYLAETAISDGDWTVSGDDIHSAVSGNVGIGAAPPTEKLDVAGTVKMSGFKMPPGGSAGYVLTSDGSGVGTWQESPGGEVGGSGTTNYIPKFTSSTTVGNSDIYQSGSNIGIGIITPGSKVHVRDGTYGQVTVDGSVMGSVVFGDNNDAVDNKYHYIRSEGDKLYMGKVNDGFNTWTNSFTMLRSNGYVGIGTTGPAEKLHVAGDIRLNSGGDIAFADDNTRIYESSNYLYFTADEDIYLQPDDDIYIRKDGGSSWIRFNNDDERIGIGTTAPLQTMHVRGGLTKTVIDGTSYGMLVMGDYNDGTDQKYFHIRSDGSALTMGKINDALNTYSYSLAVTRDGNVGIGLSNPSEKLHVSGKVYISSMDGTTSGSTVRWYNNRLYYYSSSEKYKEDIQPLEDDFNKILKAQPMSFTDKVSGERNIGFIAEEFDRLGLDHLVNYREGQPDALKYELVSLYLLEVVKDLKANNEKLEKRIEELESKE